MFETVPIATMPITPATSKNNMVTIAAASVATLAAGYNIIPNRSVKTVVMCDEYYVAKMQITQ
jgi:hypothetical protein